MEMTDLPTKMSRRIELLLAFMIIGLSIIYQVHCAIHGFDLTDEGYLMSIYQWFGTDINFAKGAGGYPLTSYLGWLLNSWTPGILPMRLWGIGIVALTEIIVYLYLRRHFNPVFVLVGLLIQAVMVAGDPKPFGYNTLTAFTSIIALITILEGARRQWYSLLFIGGLFLGANVFVRIPNVLAILYIFIPYYYAIQESSWKTRKGTLQSLIILIGIAFSIVLIWCFFPDDIKIQVMELLCSITNQMEGSSTHSTSNMLISFLRNYGESILYTFLFITTILWSTWSLKFRSKVLRATAFITAFLFLFWILYLKSDILGHRMFALINGIAIAGSFYILLKNNNLYIRVISLAGLSLAFVSPLGSDRGFVTMWTGTYLALPIGLCGIQSQLTNLLQRLPHRYFSGTTRTHIIYAYSFSLLVLLAIVFTKVEFKAYYDPGFKVSKVSPILHSPLADGVKTDAKKSRIISEVVKAIQQHCPAGETILVYDSSPMLYYLTETRPFAGISWPCVFFGHRYIKEFKEAIAMTEKPPLVVLQHFNNSGVWSEVHHHLFDSSNNHESDLMKQCVSSYIESNGYRTIWANSYYSILKSDLQEVVTFN